MFAHTCTRAHAPTAPPTPALLVCSSLLGEDVFHLPLGAVTAAAHLPAARRMLASAFDVVLVLEDKSVSFGIGGARAGLQVARLPSSRPWLTFVLVLVVDW